MTEPRVYDHYTTPPATPGAEWVRFVLLSDTHSQTTPVPDGDVLLHAGDLTTLGEADDLERQIAWLESLPHGVKVITAGNHDFCTAPDEWHDTRGRELDAKYGIPHDAAAPLKAARILKACGMQVLLDATSTFVVDRPETRHYEWSVHGSPWSPEFERWAWNYTAAQAKKIYEHVRDVDILITHTPPYELGGLDRIHNGTSVGCQELTRRLTAAHHHKDALHPKLHVFGHIHEARGTHVMCHEQGETVLVNAALVEYDQALWNTQRKFSYDVVAQPVIVDIRVPS